MQRIVLVAAVFVLAASVVGGAGAAPPLTLSPAVKRAPAVGMLPASAKFPAVATKPRAGMVASAKARFSKLRAGAPRTAPFSPAAVQNPTFVYCTNWYWVGYWEFNCKYNYVSSGANWYWDFYDMYWWTGSYVDWYGTWWYDYFGDDLYWCPANASRTAYAYCTQTA